MGRNGGFSVKLRAAMMADQINYEQCCKTSHSVFINKSQMLD